MNTASMSYQSYINVLSKFLIEMSLTIKDLFFNLLVKYEGKRGNIYLYCFSGLLNIVYYFYVDFIFNPKEFFLN